MRGFLSYLRVRMRLTLKGYVRAAAFAAMLSLLLACVLGAVLSNTDKESAEGAVKIKVGLVGSIDDTYIDIGLFALQHFDSSKYYVEILPLKTDEAERMLSDGILAGYVIVPEGFAKAALGGEEVSLDYVCADTPATLVPQLMNEVVGVVSGYVTGSQSGIYGFMDLCRDQGMAYSEYSSSVDVLALRYMNAILARDEVWSVEEGAFDGVLGFMEYYGCVLVIVAALFSGIALSPVMIREDTSYPRLLCFKGTSSFLQVAAEYLPFAFILWVGFALLILSAALLGVEGVDCLWAVRIIPVLLLVTAMQFLLYELCSSVVSGVFLQLFCAGSFSFASGFVFPFFALPEGLQRAARLLPTRVAFEYLSCHILEKDAGLLWATELAVMLLLCVLVRHIRLKGVAK